MFITVRIPKCYKKIKNLLLIVIAYTIILMYFLELDQMKGLLGPVLRVAGRGVV